MIYENELSSRTRTGTTGDEKNLKKKPNSGGGNFIKSKLSCVAARKSAHYYLLIKNTFFCCLFFTFLFGQNALVFGSVKIGVITDTHFGKEPLPNIVRQTWAYNSIDIFSEEAVDFIIGLGDFYEGAWDYEDFLSATAIYEAIWAPPNVTVPVYWVMGNHDKYILGISGPASNRENIVIENTKIPALNYCVDFENDWRALFYSNLSGSYYSASLTTLSWLENELNRAVLDQKKVLVCCHVRIDSRINPSAIWGSAVSLRSEATIFSSHNFPQDPPDPKYIELFEGGKWHLAEYITRINANEIIVNIPEEEKFSSLAVIEDWHVVNQGCMFSYNSHAQREIFESSGVVRYVFQGHNHIPDKVVINGISYYTFAATQQDTAAIAEILDDDSIGITGFGSQRSYGYTQFFVDGQKGTDNNPGSKDYPKKTISAAMKIIPPGATLNVLPGTYREVIDYYNFSGNESLPTTLIFEKGCRISGAEIVTDWALSEGNYRAIVTAEGLPLEETKICLCDGLLLKKGLLPDLNNDEWTWDNNALYLGFDPKDNLIEAGQRNYGINSSGKYLTIIGNGTEISGANSFGLGLRSHSGFIYLSDIVLKGNFGGLFADDVSNEPIHLNKIIACDNETTGFYSYGSSKLNLSYSLAFNNGSAGLIIGGSSAPKIWNVTLADNNTYGLFIASTATADMINIITYNNSIRGLTARDAMNSSIIHSLINDDLIIHPDMIFEDILIENPDFIDPEQHNYKLRLSSPCIDNGYSIIGVHDQEDPPVDLAGHGVIPIPDIGAYDTSTCYSDIDEDNDIDGKDLAEWLRPAAGLELFGEIISETAREFGLDCRL